MANEEASFHWKGFACSCSTPDLTTVSHWWHFSGTSFHHCTYTVLPSGVCHVFFSPKSMNTHRNWQTLSTCPNIQERNEHFFQKESHKITYRSGRHKTELDLLQQLRRVKDCKALPGEYVTTQQKPVVFEVRMKKWKEKRTIGPKNIKWWKCKDDMMVEYMGGYGGSMRSQTRRRVQGRVNGGSTMMHLLGWQRSCVV